MTTNIFLSLLQIYQFGTFETNEGYLRSGMYLTNWRRQFCRHEG
nr:hypothetical protein K07H8.4 - Caenorhabditis elegans [Caenorhabditis elegans]